MISADLVLKNSSIPSRHMQTVQQGSGDPVASEQSNDVTCYEPLRSDDGCPCCRERKQRSPTWMYDWILDLKEHAIADSNEYGQVHFIAFRKTETVRKIREKLGNLQLTMPAWELTHTIAMNAEEHAADFRKKIKRAEAQQSIRLNHDPENNTGQPIDGDAHNDSLTTLKQIFKGHLTKYVKVHIKNMLKELYSDLSKNESLPDAEVQKLPQEIQDIRTAAAELCVNRDCRFFFQVGPVGERPLHVCSLLAAKFMQEYDFEEQGNYVTDGILAGMKSFLKDKHKHSVEPYVQYRADYSAADNRKIYSDEAYVPYGKDYCAAIGNQLYEMFKRGIDVRDDAVQLPFFKEIYAWFHKYRAESKTSKMSGHVDEDGRNVDPSMVLVVTGLYEGETLLYPRISSGDLKTVKWLLLNERGLKSQGSEPMFDLLFQNCLQQLERLFEGEYKERHVQTESRIGLSKYLEEQKEKENFQWKDYIFENVKKYAGRLKLSRPISCKQFLSKIILNHQDEFGNTMLHLAAWNDQRQMYSRLIQLGADDRIENVDGLTPFTLTARFGIWGMFKHIWDEHFTETAWTFGNVIARAVDYSQFDWRKLGSFETVNEIDSCISELMDIYIKEPGSGAQLTFSEQNLLDEKLEACFDKKISAEIASSLWSMDAKMSPRLILAGEEYPLTAIRLITLFRPNHWYQHTKDSIEGVILKKWSRGYYLVHWGDTVIPYFMIIALFTAMWSWRQLNVLDHDFWWTNQTIIAPNPNPHIESTCGGTAMHDSNSGRLQLALVFYGVPSLLRLAYVQRRIRPSDLDENEDMVISFEEMINFLYVNLESIFEVIIAALFIAIAGSRWAAGPECDHDYVRLESRTTAICSLVLFWNLFVLFKPYKGTGLLLLTTYRFLTKEFFSFLIMYTIFFAAFVMAIQTLHNANHEYLNWFMRDETIIPQIQAANNWTYLVNQNVPINNGTKLILHASETVLTGCDDAYLNVYDTAFALLDVSMGDGLGDALLQTRNFDFSCGGFRKDTLVGYIIVFWVFLTNILILNLLIAMMSSMFHSHIQDIGSVWLLDLSYRIMRYDRKFEEVTERVQAHKHNYSFWMSGYWKSMMMDAIVVFYCIPEIHFCVSRRSFVRQAVRNQQEKDTVSNLQSELGELGDWDKVYHLLETVRGREDVAPVRTDVRRTASIFRRVSVVDGLVRLHKTSSVSSNGSIQDVGNARPNDNGIARCIVAIVCYLENLKKSHLESFRANISLEQKGSTPSKSKVPFRLS